MMWAFIVILYSVIPTWRDEIRTRRNRPPELDLPSRDPRAWLFGVHLLSMFALVGYPFFRYRKQSLELIAEFGRSWIFVGLLWMYITSWLILELVRSNRES